jgi:membrane-associated phospholipid phosphatase
MQRSLVALVVGAAVAAHSGRAVADADRERTRRRAVHAGITVVAGGVWILSEAVVKGDLVPDRCRWCSQNWLDRDARDLLVWERRDLAATTSDAVGFVVAPAAALGLLAASSRSAAWIDDALPVVEAAAAQALINQAIKVLAGRRRPFIHYAEPDRPAELDDNASFYSGHTGLTFALGTSAAVVARLRGYRLEPVLWATGIGVAAATGYLRIAADKHYLTDVTVGAVVGAAVGAAVPWLWHRHLARRRDLMLVPSAGGASVAGRF